MTDKDGSLQDMAIEVRFLSGEINKAFARAVQSAFGEIELTPQELADLHEVYFPFECDGPEDFADINEDMTQEEYDALRAEYFEAVQRLRPTFLRLFKVEEDIVAYHTCDLDAVEIENIDAFLVAPSGFASSSEPTITSLAYRRLRPVPRPPAGETTTSKAEPGTWRSSSCKTGIRGSGAIEMAQSSPLSATNMP